MQRLTQALGILALAFILSFLMSQPFSISVATLLSSNDRSDFSVSDYFNTVANSRKKRILDTDIVVVNIDTLDATRRDDIAQIIDVINAFDPRAIGLDVIFERPHDDDSQLLDAVENCNNIVMASTLNQLEGSYVFSPRTDSFFRPMFPDKTYGVINIPSKYERSVVRNFATSFKMEDGDSRLSFVSALAQMVDSSAFNKLMNRGNMFEIIKFPSVEFITIEPGELFQRQNDIAGKIVLIGTLHEYGDSHITPISSHMPGVMIHAHALRTVLSGDYLKTLPKWVNWIIAGSLALFIIFMSLSISALIKGLVLRIVQVLMLLCILPLSYYLFLEHGIVVEVSYLLLMVAFSLFAIDIWFGLKNMPLVIRKTFMNKNIVREIHGDVTLLRGKISITPQPGFSVKPSDVVIIGADSWIKVMNTVDKLLYILDLQGSYTLKQRIDMATSINPKVKRLSRQGVIKIDEAKSDTRSALNSNLSPMVD